MAAHARLSPDDRRSQLLELAIRLFSERPYDDFSMDELAATAGVSKGLLYHYFPSKRRFYTETLRAGAAELLSLIDAELAAARGDHLRRGLDAYLSYVHDHAGPYRAVLRAGVGSDPELAAIADEVRESIARRVLGSMAVERPEPRLRLAIAGWIGAVEGASLDWLDHDDIERVELVQLLSAALVALLGTVGWRPKT